jgi:hypothetical protein
MPTAEEIAAAAKAEADEAARNKAMQTMVHSAVATHLKEALPKALEGLKATMAEALAPSIGEAIKAQFAEHTKANPPADPKDKNKDAPPDPEFLALQKRFDDSEKLRVANEKRAEASEKQRRDDAAIAAVRAGFGSKVRPELLETLTTAEWARGRFKFSDKGEVLMTVRRAPMAGLEEVDQDLPLKDGLDHWFRTKEAEPFLPAPGTQRTQQKAAGRTGGFERIGPQYEKPATTNAEKTARAMEREAVMAEKFPGLAR